MRDSHESIGSSEPSVVNLPMPTEMPEFLPPFPYQMYPPFWGFPYYNLPHYGANKFYLDRCKNCRMVSRCSVMTQTGQKPEEDCQQVVEIESEKVNFTLHQQNIPEIEVIKLEDKEDNAVELKKIAQQKSLSNEISEISPVLKQVQKEKTTKKTEMKDDIFQKMLTTYSVSSEYYESLVSDHLKNNSLLSQLIKYFHEKICSFKKSKQEMIKLIIRKTQRHYKIENNCKKDQRFKKFGGFKSMNSIYLEKLFSDPAFARSYLVVVKTFIDDFEKESGEKLNAFMEKVYEAENYAEFKSAMRILEQKNKMPWPTFWIEKLRKVVEQLKLTYINESALEKAEKKKSHK